MRLFTVIAAMLLILPAALAQESQATVTAVAVTVAEDGTVNVELSGTLPNSCVDVEDVAYEVTGDVIQISITTTRPDPTLMCAQAIVDFSAGVVIPADALETGEYTVNAGSISTSFEYEAGAAGEAEDLDAQTTQPEAIPESCALPDEMTALFIDEENRFCFVYPLQYQLTEDPNSIVLLVREATDPDNELPVTLTLERMTNSRLVTGELQVDLDAALLDENGNRSVERATVGERPTVLVNVRRGESALQRAYILGTDGFTIITVSPAPSINDNAAALWQTVSESFAFFAAEDAE